MKLGDSNSVRRMPVLNNGSITDWNKKKIRISAPYTYSHNCFVIIFVLNPSIVLWVMINDSG